MKKIIPILLGAAALSAAWGLNAQTSAIKRIPLTVVVPEQAEYVPQIAQSAMADKMRQIVMANGMAATDDLGQFFLTCSIGVADKQVVAGAPPKFADKMDVSFYVADAFGQKLFGSAVVPVRGVGDNETKAYIAAVRQISPAQPALKNMLQDAGVKIVGYYNEHGDQIIQKAKTLALAKQYDAAFFQLSLIPEACEAMYAKALTVATELYKKSIDDAANANLARARSIWAAGQTPEAAEQAAEYLSQILPEASCYPQAVALSKEISKRVGKTVDWEQKTQSDIVRGWRDIGVAYGNHQKSVTYSPVYLVR